MDRALIETARNAEASPGIGMDGGAGTLRRLNLRQMTSPPRDRIEPAPRPQAEDAAPAASLGNSERILARLDDLTRLLAHGQPPAAAPADRLSAIEASLEALTRRQELESARIEDGQATRLAAIMTTLSTEAARNEERLAARLAARERVIETLLAERDRAEAARLSLEDRLAAGLAAQEGLALRLDRLEAAQAARDDDLSASLGECSARLSEVLIHLESAALDRLPGSGRPLRLAIEALSAQIAAMESRLPGAGVADEDADDGPAWLDSGPDLGRGAPAGEDAD